MGNSLKVILGDVDSTVFVFLEYFSSLFQRVGQRKHCYLDVQLVKLDFYYLKVSFSQPKGRYDLL